MLYIVIYNIIKIQNTILKFYSSFMGQFVIIFHTIYKLLIRDEYLFNYFINSYRHLNNYSFLKHLSTFQFV